MYQNLYQLFYTSATLRVEVESDPGRRRRSFMPYKLKLENKEHLPFSLTEGPMSNMWQLIVDDAIDYEDNANYEIVISASNGQHITYKNFTITVSTHNFLYLRLN